MSTIEGLYGTPPTELADWPADITQFSPLMPGAEALEAAAPASLDRMVILAPPGTLERRYVLAAALRLLKPGGQLIALAPKDKGGARIARELTAFGCDVEAESRRHHRICTTTRPEATEGIEATLNEAGLQQVDGGAIWSQPGVFSWDRLDPGSALLMEALPPLSGRGADLGCGIGFLAAAVLASDKVTSVIMVDTDRRAIEAAKRNVTDTRASTLWADVRQADIGERLDFIVMNPPFHDGGNEDRVLGQHFIVKAASALRPRGVCWLVANRHLPYEETLNRLFSESTLVADRDGYKIYRAEK